MRICRVNPEQEALGAEIRSLMIMLQDFSSKVNSKLVDVVKHGLIENWSNPQNESMLLARLETLVMKADKTEADFIKISAICAVLQNFVDEPEVE